MPDKIQCDFCCVHSTSLVLANQVVRDAQHWLGL
jgi:hypothetical protein